MDAEPLDRELRIVRGLGVYTSAVFIVGTMCGSGILAVPSALVGAGWIGIALLIFCGILSSFTGSLLGKCWTVICTKYPEKYGDAHVFDPYPTIAWEAAGRPGQIATRFCIDATLFGGATVFMLLIAGNMSELVKNIGHHDMSLCWWVLIIGGVLIPLTWLGTPEDFWQAGVIAAATTAIAALLIVIGVALDSRSQPKATHASPTVSTFFTSFGTILYSFGGASCFPTIQVDMREPEKFPKAVVLGIGSVLALYVPVGLAGFLVYGDNVETNIIDSLPSGGLAYTVSILISSHLFMAYLIVINPINQELEGFFGVPNKFGLKRAIVRTVTTGFVIFVCLTIPHFGVIMSLVGGSTVAATNFIFPPLYYLLLTRQTAHPERQPLVDNINNHVTQGITIVPLYVKLFMYEIIAIGVVCGISSTFFAIQSLANGESGFTVPCYVDITVGD